MKSFADAQALCEKEKDPFYLDVFMLESWLGHLILAAVTEYAEKRNARERQMQSGDVDRGGRQDASAPRSAGSERPVLHGADSRRVG